MGSMMPVTAMAETADADASPSYTVWLSSSADTADPESEFTVDVNISADGHTAPPSAAQIKLSVKDAEYVASKSDVTNGKTTYKDGTAVISYYSDTDNADKVFDSDGRFTVAQYTFRTGVAGTSSEISVTDASGAASGSTLDASFLISENNGKVTVKSVGYVPELITEINSADDLVNFAKSVNAGISYEGKTVDLNADIQLEGEWTPIGTPDHPFTGEFDGKGNKVQGLVINADKVPYETTEEGHGKTCGYGFFGNIKDAAIRNVDVSGDIKYTAENDSNYVFFAFGGIVGCSDGSATIANCVNRVNIFSECARYTMVGGIAGWLGNNAANKEIKISDCMNYGQIKMHLDNKESTAYQSFAGGIAGLIGNAIPSSGGVSWQQPIRSTDITVERCGNYGSLTKESTKLHGAGNSDNGEGYVDYEVLHGYTGGILGMTSSCGEVVINECTNKGEIYGWHKFVGGIMGGIYRGTVQNCYNTGNMTTTADNKQPGQRWEATIAGIIGVTYEKVGL